MPAFAAGEVVCGFQMNTINGAQRIEGVQNIRDEEAIAIVGKEDDAGGGTLPLTARFLGAACRST